MTGTTTTEIFTAAGANALAFAITTVRSLTDEVGHITYRRDEDRERLVGAARAAALLDEAGDCLFAALNHAATYGNCVNAEAAIRALNYRPPADDDEPAEVDEA